jgi:hypothetical protein
MFDLSRIPEALRHEGRLSRRLFMAIAASLAATPVLAQRAQQAPLASRRPAFQSDPFTLGVASATRIIRASSLDAARARSAYAHCGHGRRARAGGLGGRRG